MSDTLSRRESRIARIRAARQKFEDALLHAFSSDRPSERLAAVAAILPRQGYRLLQRQERKRNENAMKGASLGNRAFRRAQSRSLFALA